MGPFAAGREPGGPPPQPRLAGQAPGIQWVPGSFQFGSGRGLPGVPNTLSPSRHPHIVDTVAIDKNISRFQGAFFFF